MGDAEMTDRDWRWLRRAAWVWIGLTLVTVGLHWAAWGNVPGAAPGWVEGTIKHGANITQVMTLPGWMVAKGLKLWLHNTPAAAVGAGVGWALWMGVAWYARRICRVRVGRAKSERVDVSRRMFLGRAVGTCGVVGLGGAAVVGAVVNPLGLRVAKYRIAVRGLPPELEGLRIVQLTDFHLGARVPESVVVEAVRVAIGLGADVYALTGDYVERGDAQSDRIGEVLAPLVGAAKIGVVGVLGNHDYYGDWKKVDASLRRAGVTMIDNGNVFVDAGTRRLLKEMPTGARGICIAGVQDLVEAVADMDGALAGVDAEMARIVLSHNPDVAERCVRAEHRVDLLVCGHTHGGQVRLPLLGSLFVPSAYGEKYRHGLVDGPRCRVLVSAGIGLTVMPVRIGVAPEIVEITLGGAKE